jgi:hypothetical protein
MVCVSIRQLGVGAVDWTAPTPLTGLPQLVYSSKPGPA